MATFGARGALVLSGFMGSGKTSVGALVASRLDVPFIDTDARLAEEAGTGVGSLFQSIGEARFREREAALVLPLLLDHTPKVIAFGGGTVTIERVRHAALEQTTLVTLTASTASTLSRISEIAGRPNLASIDPAARARDLLSLRREAYAECHATVDTDGRTLDELATSLSDIWGRDALAMPLGSRSYTVEFTRDSASRLHSYLEELSASSVIVVTDTNVHSARGLWLLDALGRLAIPHRVVTFPAGEQNKTLSTVALIWEAALQFGVDRGTVIVALGGGVTGDLAGFVASTLLRGVRCVQVPTSLLAMVDSSVGGKTGFDHAAGKNLIGSFSQPKRVFIDMDHLVTLPERERTAGLAEVVKIAAVQDGPLFSLLEERATELRAGDSDAIAMVVRASVAAKIRVVRDDERELGARALLNLGHTVGHALEAHFGYSQLLHGEAVAVGTTIEALAAEHLGLTPVGIAARLRGLFLSLGLPTACARSDVETAWPYVLSDKKRASTSLRLPVVRNIGFGRVVSVPLEDLRSAVIHAAARAER